MIKPRIRYVIRLHVSLRDYFAQKANSYCMKLGTYISCLVEDELREARDIPNYDFTPMLEEFIPTRDRNKKTASTQISVFITDEANEEFLKLKKTTGYEGNGEVITGLLLNTDAGLAYLQEQGLKG